MQPDLSRSQQPERKWISKLGYVCILLLVGWLIACAAPGALPEATTSEPTSSSFTETYSPGRLNQPTATMVAPTLPASQPPTPMSQPTTTPRPTATQTPAQISMGCPAVLSDEQPAIIYSGSVLYTIDYSAEAWAYTRQSPSAQLAFEPIEKLSPYVYLSPDRTRLAWLAYGDLYPEDLVIVDLLTKERIRFPYLEEWGALWGWYDDTKVRLFVDRSETHHQGYQETNLLFDVSNSQVERYEIHYDLPGCEEWYSLPYSAHEECGFSLDPAGQLIVYPARLDNVSRAKMVLREIETGVERWASEEVRLGAGDRYGIPTWSSDGSRFALELRPIDNYELTRLLVLSATGEQLAEVTIDETVSENKELWLTELSADGRFVLFAFEDAYIDGPGYLWNVATGEIMPVCVPGYFLRSGWWLPEANQLVYEIHVADDPQGGDGVKHNELWFLDVDTWTTQRIYAADESGTIIRFLGWTPVEFGQ